MEIEDLPEELISGRGSAQQTKGWLRDIRIDISPKLLLARGATVESIIRTKLFEHIQFHFVDDLYALVRSEQTTESELLQVPCSKADIFKSTQLSFSEKRKLMKLLQFCLDYASLATSEEAKDTTVQPDRNPVEAVPSLDTSNKIEWKNESGLNVGRALLRPQNLPPEALSIKKKMAANEALTAREFLRTTFQLTDRLLSVICYCIALLNSEEELREIAVKDLLQRIIKYVSCIGRYSQRNIFITPEYGLTELCEGFCRVAAVHGATYVLRQAITGYEVDKETSRVRVSLHDGLATEPKRSLVVSAKHLVVKGEQEDTFSGATSATVREARFVGLAKTSLLESIGSFGTKPAFEGETKRSFLVIPPNAMSLRLDQFAVSEQLLHPYSIRVLEYDAISKQVPPGFFLLHLSTMIDETVSEEQVKALFSNTLMTLQHQAETTQHSVHWSCLWKSIFAINKVGEGRRAESVIESDSTEGMVFHLGSTLPSIDTEAFFEEASSVYRSRFPARELFEASRE